MAVQFNVIMYVEKGNNPYVTYKPMVLKLIVTTQRMKPCN